MEIDGRAVSQQEFAAAVKEDLAARELLAADVGRFVSKLRDLDLADELRQILADSILTDRLITELESNSQAAARVEPPDDGLDIHDYLKRAAP